MRYKLILLNKEFLLVDTKRTAELNRDYSLSMFGKVLKVETTKPICWQDGCYPIIAASYRIGEVPMIANPIEVSEMFSFSLKRLTTTFSIEDIKKAFLAGVSWGIYRTEEKRLDVYLDSLNNPTEVFCEIDTIYFGHPFHRHEPNIINNTIKILNLNSNISI